MCHSREIWVEKHPNSARSFSIMCRQCRFQVSLLPRAQAIAAWNGRIAGHSALYGLSTPRLLQLEAIVDEILIASLKASHTTGSRDSKEQK
jgi:hypothetical protein